MYTFHKLITPYNFTAGNSPQWIRIHDVGTVSSARNNAQYFFSGYRAASAHLFVDSTEVWQVVDYHNSSWDVGDGFRNGRWTTLITNFNGISIEGCLSAPLTMEDATFENMIAVTKKLMKEFNIPAERVVRHHDASGKRCPGAFSANNWAKWNEFKRRISTTEIAKPSKVHYGHIDRYAVGSREITIEGWFLSTNTANETYPYLLFMDGDGKEITRLKAERVLRPDLRKHFPMVANWHQSGFKVKTVTPDILKGRGFHILARMAQTPGGEKPLYEFYLNGEYSATSKLTVGHIDNLKVENDVLKVSGWHFGDNIYKGLHRYLFVLDAKTHVELKRIKMDNIARPDVQKAYPQYFLANESGFNINLNVKMLRNRDIKIMTRYAADELGNKTVNEKLFNQVFTL